MTAAEIASVLSRNRLAHADEDEMQRAIAEVLAGAGIPFEREARLGRDRIDFLAGAVGIECKIKGSRAAVARQLYGYARFPQVGALVLATTRAQHRSLAGVILEKPVRVVYLGAP